MTAPRLTTPTIAVLEILLAADSERPVWGLRICDDADLGSGTVYPILARLAGCGWVSRESETDPHPGRPARTYFRLTGIGRTEAVAAIAARRARRPVSRRGGGPAARC